MGHDTPVWDLGEIETTDAGPPPQGLRRPSAPTVQRRAAGGRDASGSDWGPGLSVVFPGAGAMLRGGTAEGLFFLSALGLVAALVWAVWTTLDRLAATAAWLGLPAASGVWVLGALLVVGAALHLTNVATSGASGVRPPPAPVSAIASAILPGWGQAWNGDLGRAMVFLAGAWAVAASWLVASPWTAELLASRGLVLPDFLALFSSAPVRTATTAVVWSLATYDAYFRAAWLRE